MASAFAVEIVILLNEGEEPSTDWWMERYTEAVRRAGGMPPELAEPQRARLRLEYDPEEDAEYVRVTLPLPVSDLGRAQELCHMLASVLDAEGYTLKAGGKRVEAIPGEELPEPVGTLGDGSYTGARVYCQRCLNCALSTETKVACCGQGAAFSLADIGAILLAGDEALVSRVLSLPGRRDGVKWHPYLRQGKCTFHDPSCGCTLPAEKMPLQCRTYLCAPLKLLPPDLAVEYEGYVEGLEDQEYFIEEHMRDEGGVDFDSPLHAIREAAQRAFEAWRQRTNDLGSPEAEGDVGV